MISEHYRRQVTLLVRVIPYIEPETAFALKGGTAINLFIRNMPRLSVDIDLTYLPVRALSGENDLGYGAFNRQSLSSKLAPFI